MWMLLAAVAACGPATTGPGLAVGVIHGADGTPLTGVQVDTIEGRAFTDPEGAFQVHWKAPSQHADFTVGGARYVRAFRPDDRGARMAIRLPATRALTLRCARVAPCDLQLRWSLGDGLSAVAKPECPLGATVTVADVPAGEPVAVCAARPGAPESPARLIELAGAWVLSDDPHPLRVEVQPQDGDPPDACGVAIEGVRASETGDGGWLREVGGSVTVLAACDGRPALPRRLEVTEPTTLVIEWSAVGPELDLAPWLPHGGAWLQPIEIAPAGDRTLALPLTADERGVYQLPPLGSGLWVVGAGEPVALPAEPVEPGVLLLAIDPSESGFVGILRLDEDLDDGRILVRRAP